MKTLVICKSIHHKNTEKIGKKIAEVLNADWKDVEEVKVGDFKKYRLFGFGSGIYHGRLHRSLKDLIKSLADQKDKKAFIFSTSGMKETEDFNSFGANFRQILEEKGFEVLGEFNCPGWDTFSIFRYFGGLNRGRPNSDDLKKAEEFAKSLVIKANQI